MSTTTKETAMDQCTCSATGFPSRGHKRGSDGCIDRISVHASELGLARDVWPNHLRHDGRQYMFLAFERTNISSDDNEVIAADYREVGYPGPDLRVWNDVTV